MVKQNVATSFANYSTNYKPNERRNMVHYRYVIIESLMLYALYAQGWGCSGLSCAHSLSSPLAVIGVAAPVIWLNAVTNGCTDRQRYGGSIAPSFATMLRTYSTSQRKKAVIHAVPDIYTTKVVHLRACFVPANMFALSRAIAMYEVVGEMPMSCSAMARSSHFLWLV